MASVPTQGNTSVDRDEGVSVSSWPVAVGKRGAAAGDAKDEEEQVTELAEGYCLFFVGCCRYAWGLDREGRH